MWKLFVYDVQRGRGDRVGYTGPLHLIDLMNLMIRRWVDVVVDIAVVEDGHEREDIAMKDTVVEDIEVGNIVVVIEWLLDLMTIVEKRAVKWLEESIEEQLFEWVVVVDMWRILEQSVVDLLKMFAYGECDDGRVGFDDGSMVFLLEVRNDLEEDRLER
jgi:hypothetical protein